MRDRGFITGTITLINREKFKELMVSYSHVTLRDHSSNALKNFQEKVALFPQVLECYHTTGDYDFLLKIVVRDMQEYTRFITKDLMVLENVLKSHSSFVVNEVKRNLAYPLTP
jgi:Lrp/AsnC family leucine-responsive transcriptional regulator